MIAEWNGKTQENPVKTGRVDSVILIVLSACLSSVLSICLSVCVLRKTDLGRWYHSDLVFTEVLLLLTGQG